MTHTITIVADVSATIGTGHVMRMLTLASALQNEGCEVSILTGDLPDALARRASDSGVRIARRRAPIDSPDLVAEILAYESTAVAIDSYAIPSSTITELASRIPIVLVDDNGEHADATAAVLLNQNLHADTIQYGSDFDRSIRLLGPEYALLRDEVVSLRYIPRDRDARTVLVAIGGTDPLGLGPPIVQALKSLQEIEVVHAHGLAGDSPFTPERMAKALATATVGVIACGTTTWEAACLGLPFVGVVTTDNQSIVGDSLANNGLAPVVDTRVHRTVDGTVDTVIACVSSLLVNHAHRASTTERLAAAVDGLGALRAARTINQTVT